MALTLSGILIMYVMSCILIGVRSRHIQTRYYLNKHSVQDRLVNMVFVSGEENDADLLTKIHYAKRIRS